MDDDPGQHGKDPGDRPGMPDDLTEQPLSPNDERIVSANPSPDATAITRPSRILTDELDTLDSSGAASSVFPLDVYSPSDQSLYFGASGYDNSTGNWGEYSNYVNANNLQIVPPSMYNDNQSLLFHSGYGFDTQVGYGQFSPMASPLSPIMFDGQVYSPHQIPSYYPNNVSAAHPPISRTGMMSAGGSSGQDNNSRVLGQGGSGGGGYYVHFGSFDGGNNPSGNSNNMGFYKFPGELGSGEPFSSPSDMGSYLSPYPQPLGVLGSYEHAVGQASHGFGMVSSSSTRNFPHRHSNYGTGSISQWQTNRHNQFNFNKGGKRLWERDTMGISTVPSHGISNRGPRASKPKGSKNTSEEENSKKASSGVILDLYNRPDSVTDYENAKFFIIKSFSEDNVHKSVKYNVWASTSLGNRKLDAAYHEAKETLGNCPVFLFFSVNASGQFCGVAEMVGSVDFENDADYWQQDRWSGQFPVKWHILKDVPNSRFRHILLENNDNKPVTHSRDSQEVKLEHGIEMLKIFKEHDADTCILDDFDFYDEREKALQQKKATSSTTIPPLSDPSALNALSRDLADALRLEDGEGVHKTR